MEKSKQRAFITDLKPMYKAGNESGGAGQPGNTQREVESKISGGH